MKIENHNIERMMFPQYSFKSFKDKDLIFKGSEELKELRRYDYVNFADANSPETASFFVDNYEKYNECKRISPDYKDFICNRYFFKEFVVREQYKKYEGDPDTYTKFTKFRINGEYKVFNGNTFVDNRNLYIDDYIFNKNDDSFYHASSIVIKVAHKDQILIHLNDVLEHNPDEAYDSVLRNIPLYILYLDIGSSMVEPKYRKLVDEYKNIKEASKKMHKSTEETMYVFINLIDRIHDDLEMFCAINHYMLNIVEDNEPVEIMTGPDTYDKYDNIVTYIKSKAVEDKKIKIKLFNQANVGVNPKRENIYSHTNISVRKLCDYKFQVCAHWQYYWYGPRNDPSKRYKKHVWKEAYYKNSDKEFKIIKEMEAVEV